MSWTGVDAAATRSDRPDWARSDLVAPIREPDTLVPIGARLGQGASPARALTVHQAESGRACWAAGRGGPMLTATGCVVYGRGVDRLRADAGVRALRHRVEHLGTRVTPLRNQSLFWPLGRALSVWQPRARLEGAGTALCKAI